MDYLTRQQAWVDFVEKGAETSGTDLMPNAEPGDKKVEKDKTTVQKTAMGHLVQGSPQKDIPPEVNKPLLTEQQGKLPQGGKLHPHIDVSTKEPPKLIKEKEASYYALPGLKKFPLDSYEQVKRANVYFEEWGKRMAPAARREYCDNLYKRASDLGVQVGAEICKYGAAGYADPAEIQVAMDVRKLVISDPDQLATLDKLAELRPLMEPAVFAAAIEEFDKQAGIDWMYDEHITDPYYSTYGQKLAAESNESIIIGNEYLSDKELKTFVKTKHVVLKKTFGADLADEFRKDPRGIFDSLPLDQKKVVMRMANDNSPTDEQSA